MGSVVGELRTPGGVGSSLDVYWDPQNKDPLAAVPPLAGSNAWRFVCPGRPSLACGTADA
jgi:hypothetical protein